MLEAILHYQFMQNAVLSGILASLLAGLIGVVIVEKKMLMLSGGIAHTSFGGVGLGYLMGFEPLYGALLFAVAASLAIAAIRRRGDTQSDVAIGLFWSFGMALGIFFVAMTPGYPPDLTSYLFGNILSVTRADVVLMAVMTTVVLAVILLFFEDWKIVLFDAEFADLIGMPTRFMDYVLHALIALSVVVLIRLVGIVLVIALLSAPTAVAALFTKRLAPRMALSVAVGMAFCLTGLVISYYLGTPSGATIVMVAAASYLVALLARTVRS